MAIATSSSKQNSTCPPLLSLSISSLLEIFTLPSKVSYAKIQSAGIVYGPGVIFSDYDGVIPDLVYLSNERRQEIATGTRIYGAPNLVIEILSPGVQNMERDRKV